MDIPTSILSSYCGFPTVLKTSWSNENLDRRFFWCPNYGIERRHCCHFFYWFDPLMAPCANVVLGGLLSKVRNLEREKRKERIIWIVVIVVFLVLH
ncbi:hypothetical protein ERO13_A10G091750v2 [Gossypium hirsutum]|uniref:Zinc finger GRF-type domain-containing protein n=1 Tax=Gossypium darwinii TaxID=34276 RepID=A0A5D2EXD9_GOSDA|nr:hypothetical protein ERO13_A10G091750v2 [Gossypium hirsutum]TYG98313.1 hypothetical protein ES288_A10G107500v1 [Gossypium darwinii]